jgi:hypothetical protein
MTLGVDIALFLHFMTFFLLFTASSVSLAVATAVMMLQLPVFTCVFLDFGRRSFGPPDGSLCGESTMPQFQDYI